MLEPAWCMELPEDQSIETINAVPLFGSKLAGEKDGQSGDLTDYTRNVLHDGVNSSRLSRSPSEMSVMDCNDRTKVPLD
jgi:hypothetical protein